MRSIDHAESKDPTPICSKMNSSRHSHMDRRYWVYMVSSSTGTLYIGETNNIERRIREHKSGQFEGFASEYHCNRLVYWESVGHVQKAIGREKQLKGWRRSKKIALIEDEPALAGPGRALGRRDVVCWRVAKGPVRIP